MCHCVHGPARGHLEDLRFKSTGYWNDAERRPAYRIAVLAHKIGRSIPNDQPVAVHQFVRTDSCIFGGNSPFCGTQEPELRSVAHPAHTKKMSLINGSAGPGK
jgi:hypothetical protein